MDGLFLRKRSTNGTDKKSTDALVGRIFRINRSSWLSHLHTLGVVDSDPSFPNDCFRKGNGHHVKRMKRILLLSLVFSCIQPFSASAAHPAHPAATERSWTKALKERIRAMNAAERKELKQSIKLEWRQFKKEKKAGSEADVSTLLLTLIALILPPLAVYLHQGTINSKFWISLLLTLLIWVPGVVYALLVIFGVVE